MTMFNVVFTIWTFPHSWLITGFVTQRVAHVEQQLLTLLEHLSPPSGFSGVHVARSLVFYVMFCRWLFVRLALFLWPLCCLSFFDLHLLITSLVSSNFLTCILYCFSCKCEFMAHDSVSCFFFISFITIDHQKKFFVVLWHCNNCIIFVFSIFIDFSSLTSIRHCILMQWFYYIKKQSKFWYEYFNQLTSLK